MDSLIAFFIFATLVAIDLIAAQNWLPMYFRFGLPVYYLSAGSKTQHPATTGASPADVLARVLETIFKSRPQHPTIRFKALTSNGIALREALFENRRGFKYLPVIHSYIRLDPAKSRLSITGSINAYVVFILGYLIYRSLSDLSYAPVAVLILVVLVFSYAAQAGINHQIAREILKAWD